MLVGEGKGQREREIPKQTPPEHRVRHRARSQDPEVMTWAKIESLMLKRQPPRLPKYIIKFKVHNNSLGMSTLISLNYGLLGVPGELSG